MSQLSWNSGSDRDKMQPERQSAPAAEAEESQPSSRPRSFGFAQFAPDVRKKLALSLKLASSRLHPLSL